MRRKESIYEIMMKILVIIPAFNEGSSIGQVIHSLDEIRTEGLDILVVDDGSTDETAINARRTGKALIINLTSNLGIGGAVQTGFIYARERGYDCAIQFDGDGQHLAREVPRLISPIEKAEADVVIGSRFGGPHGGFRSSPSRRFGIRVFKLMIRLIIGRVIEDSTSGFRAYNRAAIGLLSENYPSDFPEPDAVIILGRNGFRIKEVFTEMKEREHGISSIRGIKSVYYMIKVCLSMIISGMRPKITTP
jgi:glycosyltransferase involved in cell wall biosynthesis